MGYTEKKREAGSPTGACPACNHSAELKSKAEILQRLLRKDPLLDSPAGEIDAEPTPAQREAAAWQRAIDLVLQRDMAPHPRCELCGILLGPGHIEAGIARLCGTCDHRHTTELPPPNGVEQPLVGRRGWFSDHVARQKL